jgi:hypothetical protein
MQAAAFRGAGINYAFEPQPSDAICYVSVNGNDANDGLSYGSANATFAHCGADLPSGGGLIISSGNQTLTSDPFVGMTKRTQIYIQSGIITTNVNLNIPANVSIRVEAGAGFAGTGNFTFNGPFDAAAQAFFGTGAIAFNGPGENSKYYVTTFGASGSQQSTTGSISQGSNQLTLASPADFTNGQGVLVYHAGSAPAVGATSGCAATPQGTTGSTTYTYQVYAIDANGGSGTACPQFSTSTGNIALGGGSPVSVSQFVRTGVPGLTTVAVTTSAPVTGIAVGSVIYVNNTTTGEVYFDGAFTVSAVTNSQHFSYTYVQQGYYGNATVTPSDATVILLTGNVLTWSPVSNANRYFIYGRHVSGFTFISSVPGSVTSYLDYGQGPQGSFPNWLLGININGPTNDWLVSTITSGGGTSTLFLANSAGNTVGAVIVQHDDTAAVMNTLTAAASVASNAGTAVVFPHGTYNLGTITVPLHANNWLRIIFDGANLDMYGPWLPSSFTSFEGEGGGSGTSFSKYQNNQIGGMVGADTPLFVSNSREEIVIQHIAWTGTSFSDTLDYLESPACAGNTYMTFDASSATTQATNAYGVPIRFLPCNDSSIAGFGFFASGSQFDGSGQYSSGPLSGYAVASNPSLEASLYFYNWGEIFINGNSFIGNTGIQIIGGNISSCSSYSFTSVLMEDGITDFLAANGCWGYKFERIDLADGIRSSGPLFALPGASGLSGPQDVTYLSIDGASPTDLKSEGVFNGLYYTTGTSTSIMDPPLTRAWIRMSEASVSTNNEGVLTLNAGAPTSGAIGVLQGISFFPILRSSSSLPATGGFLQLASGDQECWRNNANSANVCLGKDPSDELLWPGNLGLTINGVNGVFTHANSMNRTYTLPDASGTVSFAAVESCGTTTTCSATVQTKPFLVYGTVPLTSGTPSKATITGLPFTSASSYVCTATENTTAGNNLLKIVNTGGTSTVISGPNSVTDTINYQCVGT